MTELSPEETESTTGGYGKSISHVIIGLKTVKGTKQLKLDPTIYDAIIKEKVIPFPLFLNRHNAYEYALHLYFGGVRTMTDEMQHCMLKFKSFSISF